MECAELKEKPFLLYFHLLLHYLVVPSPRFHCLQWNLELRHEYLVLIKQEIKSLNVKIEFELGLEIYIKCIYLKTTITIKYIKLYLVVYLNRLEVGLPGPVEHFLMHVAVLTLLHLAPLIKLKVISLYWLLMFLIFQM